MKYAAYLFAFCSFLCVALRAEVVPRTATVIAVKGTPTVSGGGSAGLKAQATLAVNAQIITPPGAEVTLRFFDGTVAVVQAESELSIENLAATIENSKAVKETTVLNLRKGGVVTTLNPDKKDITEYRVRTPKGIAVAHGTVFAVIVSQDQGNATVSTMSGLVTFITDTGPITVALGQVSSGSSAMTVAQAVAANPSLAQTFADAAVSIATTIGLGLGGSAQQNNVVLAAVVSAAAEASPSRAAEIAAKVVTASAPGLGGNASSAVSVITQAAVAGAEKSSPGGGAAVQAAVATSVTTAVSNTSLNVSATAVQAAANSTVTPAENPILPALDVVQVVVSPSGP